MSDETIKVNLEGNAEKKLGDIGKAADKAGKDTKSSFADGAVKMAAFLFSLEKIKQAYQIYINSGVKGSAELKKSVGELEQAFMSLAESGIGRRLSADISFLVEETSRGLESVSQGNLTFERTLDNLKLWAMTIAGGVRESVGMLSDEVRQQVTEVQDEINDKYRQIAKQEREVAERAANARKVRAQQASVEKEIDKIKADILVKEQSEALAAMKTRQQVEAFRDAQLKQLRDLATAGKLEEAQSARLLGLYKQSEEALGRITKLEAERVKQAEAVAKAINAANKQANEGLDEFADLVGDIHDIMSKRQWAQIRLNNLQEAELLTAEEQAKLQEKINELASKENLLRRSKMENLKAIAELEKEILKTLQDAGEIPDAMADRLNNADKIRDAIDEQLKVVRNLVAASKNQNIQEDERKKLVEQARKEQEKLVTLLAHREKFAKGMVEQMGRLKQEAMEAAKALDDAFRDRTKQQGNEQPLDPRNLLNAQQKAKLQRDIVNQARKDAREQAQAIEEETADAIKDMKARGATPDEIEARRRQGVRQRRQIFKDLNRGEGKAFRDAAAEQTEKAVGAVIKNLEDRQQIDAQTARIMEAQTARLTELEKENAIMKQRLDAIEDANRRAAQPNFRRAGRLN